jgi:hypothetical protein
MDAAPPSRRAGWSPAWVLGGVAWVVALITGFGLLLAYKSAPGAAADAPEYWPAESRIAVTPGRATLVMLAHPRCSCTRASISELREIMAAMGDHVRAHVLFVKPEGTSADWEKTDIWSSAAAIPNVSVRRDDGGREASLFHTKTSGQTLVYDAEGHLLFSGGITGIRGHPGDNAGRQRVTSFLTLGTADSARSLVFGCALAETE